MKIGLLTYFWSNNPGTFLQAYATLRALKERFPNDRVELVNCRYRRVYFPPSRRHIKPSQLIGDIKRYLIYINIRKKYFMTGTEILITRDYNRALEYIEKQRYDLIVVGSDTILQFSPFHLHNNSMPIYWLPPELKCKKVMCASSARALKYEQLSDAHRKALKEYANDFDLMGVRDDSTYNLIKEVGLRDESKLQMIPDPTFSLDIDYSLIDNVIKNKGIDFSKPTVAFHLQKSFKPGPELDAY